MVVIIMINWRHQLPAPLICFIALLLIMVALLFQYRVMFNATNFQSLFTSSDYVTLTHEKLSQEFSYYVSDELNEQLLAEEMIAQDIESYVDVFFDKNQRLFTSGLESAKRNEYQTIISNYLEAEEITVDDDAVNSLSTLLSKKYVNTIFPVQELEIIEIPFQQLNRLMINVAFVFVLALISLLNFQLFFQNKQYLAESFHFAALFLLLKSLALLIYKPFFFNEQITSFISAFINRLVIINLFVIIIYIAVSVYAYYGLYKKRIRH